MLKRYCDICKVEVELDKDEEAKKLVNKLNWSYFDMSEEASDEYVDAVQTVLSELEKKDKEYEELLKAYKELKEIEESHRKENGKLRERVKELEEWNEYYRKEINKMSYETMCSVLTMIDYDQAEKFYKEGKDGK